MRIILMAVAALVTWGISGQIQADGDFPTEDSLSRSSWNSDYETAQGRRVHALVKFRGREGTYDTPFGRGRLTNIQYAVDTQSQPEKPFFQITGDWSFQGKSGQFLFASRGADKFSGNWQGPSGGGKWNGTSMYGQWEKDPNRDRWFCEYRYPDRSDPTVINVQIMLWYPNDAQRSGYYYFANKKNEIWGRCVCPSDPDFDAEVMQWSTLAGDAWTELPAGDCPAPKDGNPKLAAIDAIPDPPA